MGQPATVLLVDDAMDVREVHQGFFHGTGMEVLTAENGVVALKIARRVAPDVIVTDVDMPVMDGLALCRALRADQMMSRVAVVIITGDAAEQAGAAADAGCDALLEKPCSRTLLIATVRRLLARR